MEDPEDFDEDLDPGPGELRMGSFVLDIVSETKQGVTRFLIQDMTIELLQVLRLCAKEDERFIMALEGCILAMPMNQLKTKSTVTETIVEGRFTREGPVALVRFRAIDGSVYAELEKS